MNFIEEEEDKPVQLFEQIEKEKNSISKILLQELYFYNYKAFELYSLSFKDSLTLFRGT